MTTILVDRVLGYIAADRQATEDGRPYEVRKIHQVEMDDGVHLVAISGDVSPGKLFLEWYRDSDDWSPAKIDLGSDEDFTAVVLTPDSGIVTYDCWLRADPIMCRYYAAGTGGAYALGAAKAGTRVGKAMSAAMALDVYSGFGHDIEYIADVNVEG